MAEKITKDYALLLDNLRHALYMSENNPYTESGSVFFLDSAYNDMRGDLQDRFMKKRELGDPAFFSFEEYNNILDLYKATPEAGDNKEQINQMIFWMAHLAGWKRENFVLKEPIPTISIIFRDTKRAPKIYGQQLKLDLEKTRYKVIGGKSILYTTGASVKDGVSEDTAEKSRVASEYIVMCNYHIVSEYCGEGKKQLLKKVITDFAGNIVEAERKRQQEREHSLIPGREKEAEKLCKYLNDMMKAYDLISRAETVKKDWLLARSLSWLVIGAMLRQNLSMELLEDYLKPYLPETVEHGTVEVMYTERTSENIIPSLSVQEQFWQAGKKWYEEARKPGARFHSLDIVNHILPSAEDKPAGSEYRFPFRASDTDENAIQCSRFSELLRDKNSVYHQGHFMLIGEGGIGKTTTLMSAMQDTYEGKDAYKGESVIPLFIELSLAPDSQDSHAYDGTSSSVIHRLVYAMLQKKDSKKDRADLLRECMNEESSIARDTVHELLSSAADDETRYVLLIDGLNEVSPEPFTGRSSSAQGRILQEIREMIEGYPNVTIILTGRQGAFIDHPSFHPFYLRGLVWEEIEDYLREKGKTDGEISLIRSGDKGLLKVLSIPMFLTMYVLLRDTEGITTRGELLKVFFHERFERRKNEYDVLYRQGDISERIDQDEEQSVSGKMTRGKITVPMQWMFLDILLPEIAAKMERAHDFRISERGVRSLLESLFNEQDSLYCGNYKGFSDICFSEQLQGEDLEDVISDFTEAYSQKAARYSAAFLKYCESSMGILYREGEKSYGFVHQHFRDYFAAVCNINRMKIAYTAFQEDDTASARAVMQQYNLEPLDPVLMVYIGEYLGEHHNAPHYSETADVSFETIVTEESLKERQLISNLFNIYRGMDQENAYGVYNLIEILKRVRKDLSGADFHDLDLRRCRFYKVPLDSKPDTNLKGSIINAKNWFAEGHSGWVDRTVFSGDGSRVVTASSDGTARIWDSRTGELLHTLEGHSGRVSSVVFSGDGSRVAIVSEDGAARIWDSRTGELLHTLEGHSGWVRSAVFSGDGSRVATASSDGTARIWDSRTGELLHTLGGHSGRENMNSAVFSGDGSRVATASSDGTARIWDSRTGELLHILEGHSGVVRSAVFSGDGSRVATTSYDGTARIWDSRTGELLHTLEGHFGGVRSAVFSGDRSRVVTASYDGIARIWDSRTGELLHTLEGKFGAVNSADFSRDGSRVATASSDGTARIWDSRTGELLHTLEGYSSFVNIAAISGDGSRVVTTSLDGTARIWDSRTGELLYTLEGHSDWVRSAAFSGDGSHVATASFGGTARIWDSRTGELLHTLEGHSGVVRSVVFNGDGSRVATISSDGTARIWDSRTGELLHTLEGHSGVVSSAVFSGDGSRVATTSSDGTARSWDSLTRELLHILEGRSGVVSSAVFSGDGSRVATTSYDGIARIWDSRTRELLYTLGGHSARVNSTVFNGDGSRVATASSDGTARIWDSRTGEMLHTLEGHSGVVSSAVFSGDGSRVVTASSDGTARIWDSRTGEMLHTLEGHSSGVNSAVFSGDGSRVVTTSYDGTARIWDVKTGKMNKTFYEASGLFIRGVNFKKIDPRSKITDKQEEIFRQYGALI